MTARVVVLAASMVAREVLSRALSRTPGVKVLATCGDAVAAKKAIESQDPGVLVVDPELGPLDGAVFIRRVRAARDIRVIAIASSAAVGRAALEAGAARVVMKPNAHLVGEQAERMLAEVAMAVLATNRGASGRSLLGNERLQPAGRTVLAIGASTGGTDAIRSVLRQLPGGLPPIVVVQHMPAGFTASFASRLDEDLPLLRVREGYDGARLHRGEVWIAPGGMHMGVDGKPGALELRVQAGAKVSGHAPSVDVLFASVARTLGGESIGLLLTGMGRDGAAGLLRLKQAGSATYAQDEASSVVWGMPRAAWEMGAARELVDLDRAAKLLRRFRMRTAA